MKKQRRVKLPIRLSAKPTRPHSSKKGARDYDRKLAKKMLHRELHEDSDQKYE